MLNPQDIELQTGKLQISVYSTRYPLDTLLTFGSRQNPKRRYLFISKVLGKYFPCKPSEMRQTYRVTSAFESWFTIRMKRVAKILVRLLTRSSVL